MQQEIFQTFRRYTNLKVVPYLEQIGVRANLHFSEGSQWLTAKFTWKDNTLSFNVSLHHLDYRDGITVYIKTKFGQKELRNEVRKYSASEVLPYGYGVSEMNAQFDRIIKDLKLYFEKYMLV